MAPLPPPPPPPPRLPPPPPSAATGPTIAANTYDHSRQRWGLLDAAAVVALFFIAGLLLSIPAAVTTDNLDDLLASPWLPVVVVGPVFVELAYLGWISRRKGLGFAKDFQLRFARMDLLTGLLCWFLAWVLVVVVVIIMTTFGGEAPSAAAAELALDSADGGGITIWLVLFAVGGSTIVPVVEELVFRGLLWSALEKRGVNNIVSLVITSVAFAAIHIEPERFFVLLALGTAIGLARLTTGRIAASIVAHALLNSMAFMVILAQAA